MISAAEFKQALEHAVASNLMTGHGLSNQEVMDLAVKVFEAALTYEAAGESE
jgi:UDP-glucose 4-epimerase